MDAGIDLVISSPDRMGVATEKLGSLQQSATY
jgi:hypothetical protein